MMMNSVHYKATIKMTSNNQIIQISIPSSLDMNNAKFVVGSCAGKVLSGGQTLIHIHCEQLRHHCQYSSSTERNDLIGRAVLSEAMSLENSFESVEFLGCPVPKDLGSDPKLHFTLTDENYNPLTTLNFLEFELVILGSKI